MDTQMLKALGSFNASNAVLLAQKTWLNKSIPMKL